ncbi:MAG: hypothetical protein AAGM22_30655 [Acidobacteriota bacterium]
MLPILETLRLEDLRSSIDVSFRRGPSSTKPQLDILIVSYRGRYPFGSSGNTDAEYMHAMGLAAVHAFSPSGLIIDMSDLHYEWGDRLEKVFDIGYDPVYDERLPTAAVVGPECRDAVRSLIVGTASEDFAGEAEWVFESLESAWSFVDALMNQKD